MALTIGLSGSSRADSVALQFGQFGPPANAGYYGGGSSNISAYEFTSSQDISVTALGFYDLFSTTLTAPGAADGLNVSHQVGIYRVSDQALITSGIVPAGTVAPKIDSFRYTSVAPVTLSAGVEYVIGATVAASVNGVFDQDATVNANVGSDILANPLITVGDWRTSVTGDGFTLSFPGFKLNLTTDTRNFGPNFLFSTDTTFNAVPEPATLTMFGIAGVAALGLSWRRRKA